MDNLGQLLLDEEGPEMRELPGASNAKDNKLNNDPSDNTGICRLGLVSELSLSLLNIWSAQNHYSNAENPMTLTRWKTCSLRISARRALRSLTRDVMS